MTHRRHFDLPQTLTVAIDLVDMCKWRSNVNDDFGFADFVGCNSLRRRGPVSLRDIAKRRSAYLTYAKRDPYGRPDSCSLRRQGSISPNFGARDHVTGAVKVSKCGKGEEDDSSVKRPEVCNTLQGEG